MRNLAYYSNDDMHGSARASAWTWCSAVTTALVLAFAPVTVQARALAPADAAAPAEEPAADAAPADEPAADEPAADEPAADEPAADEPATDEPEPAPVESAPVEAEPTPSFGPPPPDGPTPDELAKNQKMRKAGVGVMTTGGVLGVAGLGITLAFTVLGDKEQKADVPDQDTIDKRNNMAQVGGALVAGGIALIAIGGIVFVRANKKKAAWSAGRVQVTPSVGGMVLTF